MIIPLHTEFKKKELLEEYQSLKARAQLVSEDMAKYCSAHGMEYVITDIMSDAFEDKKLNRVSKSHSEGRAWDVRILSWPQWFKEKFKKNFEKVYEMWAATSSKTMQKNLIVYHDNGNGSHAHCQISQYKEMEKPYSTKR